MRFLLKLILKPIGCLLSLLISLLLLIAILCVAALWALDYYAASIAAGEIEQRSGFPTQIEDGGIEFLDTSLVFWNVSVENPAPQFQQAAFLEIRELRFDIDPRMGAQEEEIVLESVLVDIGKLTIAQTGDGANNLHQFTRALINSVDWAAHLDKVPQEHVPTRLRIDKLVLRIDQVAWQSPGRMPVTAEANYERTFMDVTQPADVWKAVSEHLRAQLGRPLPSLEE